MNSLWICNISLCALLITGNIIVYKQTNDLAKQKDYLDKQMPIDILNSNQEKEREYEAVYNKLDSLYSKQIELESSLINNLRNFKKDSIIITEVRVDTIYVNNRHDTDLPFFECESCRKEVKYTPEDVKRNGGIISYRYVDCPFCKKTRVLN